jgi:hypothetical protein
MLKTGTFIIFLTRIIFTVPLFAQEADTATKVITIANSSIKDCIATYKTIWILKEDGVLLQVNSYSYAIRDSIKLSKKIVAIGSNGQTIYAGTEDGVVHILRQDGHLDTLWVTEQDIRHLTFTSGNRCFIITNEGIYHPEKKRTYLYHKAKINPFAHQPGDELSAVLVDRNENIWLGFAAGEWGGDIIIFSSGENKFISPRKRQWLFLGYSPVKSIFQVDTAIYASYSVAHSSVRSSITEMTNPVRYVFKSGKHYDIPAGPVQNLYNEEALYLGPATYNFYDSSIYFYSQMGVFKSGNGKDLGKIENWSRAVQTELMWPGAGKNNRYASKMFFNIDKLYVLNPDCGIFVWDGKRSVLLKTTYTPRRYD